MFPIYGLSIAHQAPSIVVRGPKDYRKTLKVTVYGMGWRLATAKGHQLWDGQGGAASSKVAIHGMPCVAGVRLGRRAGKRAEINKDFGCLHPWPRDENV